MNASAGKQNQILFDYVVLVISFSHPIFFLFLTTRSVQTRGAAGPGRSVCSHVDETAEKPRRTNRDTEEQSD